VTLEPGNDPVPDLAADVTMAAFFGNVQLAAAIAPREFVRLSPSATTATTLALIDAVMLISQRRTATA
jgi:hypothetical protein